MPELYITYNALWSGKFDKANWALIYLIALIPLTIAIVCVGIYWKVTHPLPGRPWYSFSLRTLFATVLGVGLLFGMIVNLNWMGVRHVYVYRMLIPATGTRPAPVPIRWLGAPGYERIDLQSPANVSADDFAHDVRRLQREFPEADIVITAKD